MFDFPTYDGEVKNERLYNWVCRLEVYSRIKMIKDDETKIHLASLRLESVTLIWSEAKTQEDLKKRGKIITSWNDFVASLRRHFYPL